MNVDKSNKSIQRMFGQIAPRYDFLNHLLSMNVDRYWRRQCVRKAPPTGEEPILDVCTGTGDLAFCYHRRSRGRVPIVGVDFCAEMLEVAVEKGKRHNVGNPVDFVRADAQQLPFEDDTFQIVTVAFGLRNIEDTDRGLREMARVCLPGGRVAVLEFSMPTRRPVRAVYAWYFRHVLPRIGQWVTRSEREAYLYLPESVGEFPSGEALAERMRASGLSHVECHSLTFGIATLYMGEK